MIGKVLECKELKKMYNKNFTHINKKIKKRTKRTRNIKQRT